MFYSLDRYEGDFAILIDDDGGKREVLREELPADAREGSVLTYGDGWQIDVAEGENRRNKAVKLKEKLFSRGKSRLTSEKI